MSPSWDARSLAISGHIPFWAVLQEPQSFGSVWVWTGLLRLFPSPLSPTRARRGRRNSQGVCWDSSRANFSLWLPEHAVEPEKVRSLQTYTCILHFYLVLIKEGIGECLEKPWEEAVSWNKCHVPLCNSQFKSRKSVDLYAAWWAAEQMFCRLKKKQKTLWISLNRKGLRRLLKMLKVRL